MDSRDDKLLSRAGFILLQGGWHFNGKCWSLMTGIAGNQYVVEMIADAVLKYDWEIVRDQDTGKFNASVHDYDVTSEYGDYQNSFMGYGDTRAEAITNMLYRWLERTEINELGGAPLGWVLRHVPSTSRKEINEAYTEAARSGDWSH